MIDLYVNYEACTIQGLPELLTLHDICFNSICENIHRINALFLRSTENVRRSLFHELRLNYSNKIIKRVTESGRIRLNEIYFDILVNNYLTELVWPIFNTGDLNTALRILERIGENLEKVSFKFPNHNQIPGNFQEFVNVFQHLPNVKVIQIRNYFDDLTLTEIYSTCKGLEELYLLRCSIADEELQKLCPAIGDPLNLKTLVLKGLLRPCNDGISYLLTHVRTLECIYYENLLDVFHALNAEDRTNPFNKLTSLGFYVTRDMNDDTIRNALNNANELCPSISKINIHGKLPNNELQMLFIFPQLKSIYVFEENERLDLSDFLRTFGVNIRKLKLYWCGLRISTLFGSCPNVESVLLRCINYYDFQKNSEYFVNISRKVKSFVIYKYREGGNNAEDTVIEQFLDSCPILKKLIIKDYSEQPDIIEKYCDRYHTLEKLAFMDCSFEEDSLRRIISSCTNLRSAIFNKVNDDLQDDLQTFLDVIPRNVVLKFKYRSVVKEKYMEQYWCIWK